MIFTNNPTAREYLSAQPGSEDFKVNWVGFPAMEVLVAARVAIRQGASLISNPMAGATNKKPINPYISVVTTPQLDAVDFSSVKRINEAIAVYKNNGKLRFFAHHDDTVKRFQDMDMEMLASLLQSFNL